MSFSFTITRIDIMVYSIPCYRVCVYLRIYVYIYYIHGSILYTRYTRPKIAYNNTDE